MHKGIIYALLAAVLFGASTPFAKLLGAQVEPVALAGILYLGSGIGLSLLYFFRLVAAHARITTTANSLRARDLPWLGGAILFGGVAGPVLLMLGLNSTPAASASLLLNMEGVLTALLAWFVFRENFDRRIFLGMLLIISAGGLLSWEQGWQQGLPWGAIAIIGACLCWAIDNNLTRKVAAGDAVQIAALKGLIAGSVNLLIAFASGMVLPEYKVLLSAGLLGFFGYGLSLMLFVLALRHLGTARTGAYFSAAPFAGAVISLLLLGETPSLLFWAAASLMAVGLWLHLSETHSHTHAHPFMEHVHSHTHDDHHPHTHAFAWDGTEPHTHLHQHQPMTHEHAHFPDIYHRHPH